MSVLKWIYINTRWDTRKWCTNNSCEKGYSLFLLADSDRKRLDINVLYFIITNVHTELKSQIKLSHEMISPTLTQYTTFD